MNNATRHETFELDHFEKSVNAATGRVRGLWLGYIVLVAYLIITVGSVTHRDLFLENPVRLPVLNVDLSLKGFFAIAPVFFLINHFYLLLHLVGLRWRIREYDEALDHAMRHGKLRQSDEDTRRRGLDSFVIVRAFGGTREERRGATSWFFRIIIWITIIAAPIFVLLQMQLVFIAYHDPTVTWIHRGVVFLDLVLLWLFWPMILRGHPRLKFIHPFSGNTAFLAGLVFSFVLGVSVLVMTFPGEALDRVAIRGISKGQQADWSANPHKKDWETPQDPVLWAMKQHLPLNLDLPGAFLIDSDLHERIIKRKPEGENPFVGERTLVVASIAGKKYRNLIAANLAGADLRTVEMSGASLQGASLDEASLQGASFNTASLQGASLDETRLQGASLIKASLQGASLDEASLQGASLDEARLQGASLDETNLQGASLIRASLEGTSLDRANLQGASLDGASLQGASLDEAGLQGASLDFASLQGASLDYTRFQGASLMRARLEGASLNGARLQGASLNKASLQGVDFSDSSLRQAELINTHLWRSYGSADFQDPLLIDVDFKALSIEEYSELKKASIAEVKSAETIKGILDRLSRLDPTSKDLPGADLNIPMDRIDQMPSHDELKTGLYKILFDLGCHGGTEPYIAQNISHRLRSSHFGDTVAIPLARIFLDASDAKDAAGVDAEMARTACPGAVGISNKDKESLRWFIDELKPD